MKDRKHRWNEQGESRKVMGKKKSQSLERVFAMSINAPYKRILLDRLKTVR